MPRTRSRSKARARRGRGSGRSRRPRKERGRIRSAGSRVSRHLSPRAADIVGVGLVVLALLTVLGLWFQAGGPFGRLFEVMVRGLFGPVGYAFPIVAGYWAVLMIRGTAEETRGRMLVGLAMIVLGVLGCVSVFSG